MVTPATPDQGWSSPDPDRWRMPREGVPGGADVRVPRPDHRADPMVHQPAAREARVLGGSSVPTDPPTVWDNEPWVTVRSAPKLFGYGVPGVLIGGALIGIGLADVDVQWAFIVAFGLQALGIAAITMYAQRKRTDPLKKHLPGVDEQVM